MQTKSIHILCLFLHKTTTEQNRKLYIWDSIQAWTQYSAVSDLGRENKGERSFFELKEKSHVNNVTSDFGIFSEFFLTCKFMINSWFHLGNSKQSCHSKSASITDNSPWIREPNVRELVSYLQPLRKEAFWWKFWCNGPSQPQFSHSGQLMRKQKRQYRWEISKVGWLMKSTMPEMGHWKKQQLSPAHCQASSNRKCERFSSQSLHKRLGSLVP